MNKYHIQLAGMVALTGLAGGLLGLMAYLFGHAIDHMSADGKVPVLDAGMFSTCLVTFQTVVGAIRSIWESQERTTLAENLSQSTPVRTAPQTARDAAQQTADAATNEADKINQGEPS